MRQRPEHTRATDPGANRKLHIVDGQRKPAAHAFVPREVRRAVVAGLREHHLGIQRVSKRHGLAYNDALDVLIEETEMEKRAAFQQGYRVGRMTPPLPPAPGRRAA